MRCLGPWLLLLGLSSRSSRSGPGPSRCVPACGPVLTSDLTPLFRADDDAAVTSLFVNLILIFDFSGVLEHSSHSLIRSGFNSKIVIPHLCFNQLFSSTGFSCLLFSRKPQIFYRKFSLRRIKALKWTVRSYLYLIFFPYRKQSI